MNEKQAVVLATMVKDILNRVIELVLELESATGLEVVSKEYLKEWQE